MSKRTLHIFSMVLLAAMAVASCRHYELEEPGVSSGEQNHLNDGRIRFVAGSAASVSSATRSSAAVASEPEFLCAVGEDSLYMSATVEDNHDFPSVDRLEATKGSPVSGTIPFYLTAILANKDNSENYGRKYIDNIHLESDNGVYTTDYFWPTDKLHFYATNFRPAISSEPLQTLSLRQAGTKASSVEQYGYSSVAWEESLVYYGLDEAGAAAGSFSYSLPEPDPTVSNDAQMQPDYVFAIAKDKVDGGEPVDLNFAHCFSAVSLKFGENFLDPEGRQVREVKITGVPSSGICDFAPAENGAMSFDWNTEGADRKSYSQKIAFEGTDTNIDNNEVISGGDLTFMLIPHTLLPDAKIKVTISLHGKKEISEQHIIVVEKSLAELTPEWLPGKKYTYVISGEEKVELEVTDALEANVKGDLCIRNTGTAGVNVRAYIVGWWENDEGYVVAPWIETDGKFTGTGWADDGINFTGTGSAWEMGADGFFYYRYHLWPGFETEKLFDTYTLTASPPIVGARLVLNVVSQAVIHYAADSVWASMRTGSDATSESYDSWTSVENKSWK